MAKDIAKSLRECFIQVKNVRKEMLEVYVNKCAVKIQKVFRGWFIRERVRPLLLHRTLNMSSRKDNVMHRLSALIQGWRIRKIMRTKEIGNYIR